MSVLLEEGWIAEHEPTGGDMAWLAEVKCGG